MNYRVSNSELAVAINSLVGIVTARDLQTSLLKIQQKLLPFKHAATTFESVLGWD